MNFLMNCLTNSFIGYHRSLVVIALIAVCLIGFLVSISSNNKHVGSNFTSTFCLIFLMIPLLIWNESFDKTTNSFNDYFKDIYFSRNFIEDKGKLSNELYNVKVQNIINANNMSLGFLNPYQIVISIEDINKDYLLNNEKSDPDLNICNSIAQSAKRYAGVIEDPSSCVSKGKMRVFFDMRARGEPDISK